jgi:hypothetical protein
MKKIVCKRIISLVIILVLGNVSYGANRYWDNGGADNNWSTPANWTGDTLPVTGDTVILENSAPDAAQVISLDTNVSLAAIRCNATGNRDYTIQTSNGSKLTLTGTYDVNGSTMTVDWTLDIDLIVSGTEIRFYRTTNGTITVNGNIGPAGGTHQIWGDYTGELVLAGSNTASETRNYGSGEITVKNSHALGDGTYRNYGDGGTLSLATDTMIYNYLQVSYPMNLRIKDAGSSDITLTVNGQATEKKVTVLPNAGGSTGNLKVKLTLGSTHHAEWNLLSNSTVAFATASGVAGWGHSNPAYGGWITGSGGVLVDCAGSARVDCYITNDFTGGLVITNGSLFLRGGNDRLPTNGNVTVYSGATLRLYGGVTQMVGIVSGAGTVNMDGGDLTASGVASGDGGAGILTIAGQGNFILQSGSVSTFELDSIAGLNDLVTFSSSVATLTFAGALNVENLGGMETGDYKLFDLQGGVISGGFSSTNMPRGFLGEVSVSGGDVILSVTLAPQGTVVMVK